MIMQPFQSTRGRENPSDYESSIAETLQIFSLYIKSCWYLLESPRRSVSTRYPQYVDLMDNRRLISLYHVKTPPYENNPRLHLTYVFILKTGINFTVLGQIFLYPFGFD